jgi:hypothetical protein
MIFDTAEAVKGQFITGTDKMKDLVGYDAELVEKAKNMAINHPVSKKVVGIVLDITEKVSENPMIQKAEKATEDLKNMGISKYNEFKGDVLEQASKIIDKGEAMIEDAKSTPKAKVTKKVVSKKKVAAKKTVAKKATATKAKTTKVVSKAAPKKTVAKKATKVSKVSTKVAPKAKAAVAKVSTSAATKATTATKATVAKVTEVKKTVTANVAEVKTKVTK